MTAAASPTRIDARPVIQGVTLDDGPDALAPLAPMERDAEGTALAGRLADDGYLYLPGFFPEADVAAARRPMVARLAAAGFLDPAAPPESLIARPGLTSAWLDGLTDGNPLLMDLLYGRTTMSFFDRLFGAPARHFDFTWSRATGHGLGTAPHCDVVFMGRGTPHVVSMWTAMSDIPMPVGGLAVLERSHVDHINLRAYRSFDVDTYCANLGHSPVASMGAGGSLPHTDPNALRAELGGRWLWTDFRAGDVLLFGLGTVHASLDNQSNVLRLSTDTRYQRADEPIDERWTGTAPLMHTLAAQRPRIC